MFKFPSILSIVLLSTPVFADFDLPPVDPSRTVSAMDLYGVAPAQKQETIVEPKIASNEGSKILVPRKPTDDLWTNGNEAPLRMPEKSEYAVLKANSVLPEETLDDEEDAKQPTIVRNVEKPSSEEVQERPLIVRSMPRAVPAPIQKPFVDSPAKDNDADEFAYKGDVPFSKLSPAELKKAFKRTFTLENKHLATYKIDDGFDDTSVSEAAAGFNSERDLSEDSSGIRPLEIKIGFDEDNSSLSRDNYNLLTEYAGIVSSNPKRAVQVSISERSTRSYDDRKLAARRLAIIEQVLKDSGIVDRRIIPVLSQRSDDSFVLRVISSDTYQTLSEQRRDMFGDSVASKTYKSMSW